MVTRGCVQGDRAGVIAQNLAAQIVAVDLVERCSPCRDAERRIELGDLLADEADAFKVYSPPDFEDHAIGPAIYLLELALNVLDGIAVRIALSLKITLVFFHRHQARSSFFPDQPISRSPLARNGPPPSRRRAN